MAIPKQPGHERSTILSGATADHPMPHQSLRQMARRLCGLTAMLTVCVALVAVPGNEARAASEAQVKAAFLYNFAKFVEWPAQAFSDASAAIVVGIVGDDQMADAADKTCRGKTIDGRRLVCKRLSGDSSTDGCQVLFIGSGERRRVGEILDRARDSSVLTISDTDGFMQNGGVIGFVIEDNKIGFEVNMSAARRKHLKISSQLLKLARNVRD